MSTLDELIPDDHRVRLVWQYVERLDLGALEAGIQSREGGSGRPAIDPRLLFGLWLYATVDGVGSARMLARLCEEALPYRWLCGGVSVNYHTLSDFRVGHQALLSDILTRSVAALLHQKLVTLARVAQDGVRVRASAGQSSFHRRGSLKECLAEAKAHLKALESELEADPAAGTLRQQAARIRAAAERQERIERALAAADEMVDRRRPDPRASSTDPDARLTHMADGGTRPAYNVQFATDSDSRLIVGVAVTKGGDQPALVPMLQQIVASYGRPPAEHLVDGGYISQKGIEGAAALGTVLYMPLQKKRRNGRDPEEPRPADSPAVAEWRERMATDEAKEIYAHRGEVAEWANAQARNRGLTRFTVRGLAAVTAATLWYALAHNLMTVSTGGLALTA